MERFKISTGRGRFASKWKQTEMTWADLLERFNTPTRTQETYAEYVRLGKEDQDRIKDVGGFVGGTLEGGIRKRTTVGVRSLVTLDADFAPVNLEQWLDGSGLWAYAAYSTHKHRAESPRVRVIFPLDRTVTPDEYEAIGRRLAAKMGMDFFDDTTYQPSRLMYWPSVSIDGEFFFREGAGCPVCASEILAEYEDWTDVSSWPVSSRAADVVQRTAKKQGAPQERPGLIGAFCRTYDIDAAIAKFIPDVYTPCSAEGRYTYTAGSTAAGLVIYEDVFAYSNHATDPAGGKLLNAFDLVRVHLFGALDTKKEEDATKLPSYKAMLELAQKDPATRLENARARKTEAVEAFADEEEEEEGDAWLQELEVDKAGGFKPSLNNAALILQKDPNLKGIVYNQLADDLEIVGAVPWKNSGKFWRDADDAQLEAYLAQVYVEFPKAKILTAVSKAADDRAYHPVREYLAALPAWDGVERVDRLLVDYMGSPDTDYTRAVTRKTLCAAIRRVQSPGCKFDTVLVLCGPQGTGKSTLFARLAVDWHADNINLTDTRDKTAAEKLQGVWIAELPELSGLHSASIKVIRGFITTQNDRYRASYGRRVSSHPRQSIFVATTNAVEGYLNDVEGGRRFWPVDAPGTGIKKSWDLTAEEVKQIWAEVKERVKGGEPLILPENLAGEAVRRQKAAMVTDPRGGMVEAYLDLPLPEDWYERDIDRRRDFLYGSEVPRPETPLRRDFVSPQEIWVECFGCSLTKMNRADTFAIRGIMAKMDGWEYREERRRDGAAYGRLRGYWRVFDVKKHQEN